MKLYIRDSIEFNPETIEFYKKNFELVEEKKLADVIVINDFRQITSDKPVACNSTGVEHIHAKKIISLRGEDLKELTAVPELCLGMAIYTMRVFKGQEMKNKTLGIIGLGRIGIQLSDYARIIGAKVIGYDKLKNIGKLEKVLEESDIVSIQITADRENTNFLTKKHFEKMKEGAILLNSARPWMVEMNSLRWALDNKLAGAWFDFELMFTHPKLITTSHLGGTTPESKKISEMIIAKRLCEMQKNR